MTRSGCASVSARSARAAEAHLEAGRGERLHEAVAGQRRGTRFQCRGEGAGGRFGRGRIDQRVHELAGGAGAERP